jgi:hypothetical protein
MLPRRFHNTAERFAFLTRQATGENSMTLLQAPALTRA